ncbi:MAG: 5'/3'-nucleotidase SurE [Fibrobacter sp.]|jgi:5'-nucleotidase|nr:5'/3'-nucleotidase SurE [Fibrobacter sp.]
MEDTQKPYILITNDDGIGSSAMISLAEALSEKSRVFVVAPKNEQSGVGHAFTHRSGLVCKKVSGDFPFEFHSISGTPADCVKFAVSELYRNFSFDLVISGINFGENAGVSSFYSGTVAGAREAALWGLRGLAISLSRSDKAWIRLAIGQASRIVAEKLYLKMARGTYWNVNFPLTEIENYQGLRVAPMNHSMFTDHYRLKEGSFWLHGEKLPEAMREGSDDWCLSNGYASLTPFALEQTAPGECLRLQEFLNT